MTTEWVSSLHAVLRSVLEASGIAYVDQGDGWWRLYSSPHDDVRLSVANLELKAASTPLDQWFTLITAHVALVVEQPHPAENAESLDQARPFLRCRIVPESYLKPRRSPDNGPVQRRLAEGLLERLDFDLPRKITGVRVSQAHRWGVDIADLYTLGRGQLADADPGRRDLVDFNGHDVTAITESDWSAAQALPLLDRPHDAPPLLVGIPARNVLSVYEIAAGMSST